MEEAIKQSKVEKKEKKKKKNAIDQGLVQALHDQFNGYFTMQQVEGTIRGNEMDVDKAIASLVAKRDLQESKGTGNVKKMKNE